MSGFHFVTFADKKYKLQQFNLCLYAKELNQFETVSDYSKESDLIKTSFYNENKEIFDQERGCGYWLWKPFYILKKLEEIDDGDIVFYADCADVFMPQLIPFLRGEFDTCDVILLQGAYKNKDWTKRDCFVMMDCDSEEYWDHNQLEAGIGFFKKTAKTIEVVNEWLEYCKNPHILTDAPNQSGYHNFPSFQDHRHDQSILTNIAIKHNLRIENELIRQFINCNVNEAL
mgnify:CR=1 FL=1